MLRSVKSVKCAFLAVCLLLVVLVLLCDTRGGGGRWIDKYNLNNDVDQMEKIKENIYSDIGQKDETPSPPRRIRISCWIMTSAKNLETRAVYIQQTWSKRCDRVVFISSETNATFPTIGVNSGEGRGRLTEKTLGGFAYVAHNHLDDCDWFFKADDDTYVIIENLRHFLEDKDPNEPIYYGHHFKTLLLQGYSSGGSGMVVSREAMLRFAEKGLDPETCRQTGTAGDAAFGECMQSLGVRIGNSSDAQGRSRFHCLAPRAHITGHYPEWYFKYDANGVKMGIDSLSDFPISFHYVEGTMQLELEYMFYHAKVHSHDRNNHH